jgi:hypothetical protein
MHLRIALTFLAVTAAVPTPAAGETVITGPRHAHLYTVADAFDRAQLTQDRATLERMVDDTLIFIQADGTRADKKAFIDGWTTPGDRYDPVKLSDREIVPLGPDAFLVSAYAELSGTSGGKRFSSRFRFTDTFRRIGGEWRAVHIQVTRIAN